MTNETLSPPQQEAVRSAPEAGRGSVLEILERLGTVVVPVAVAVYALLYMGFESVYDTFGVTPDQAGITQTTIFGHLISTLVLVFLALLPLLGLVIGLCWAVDRITRGAAGRALRWVREKPWPAAAAGAALSGVAYWGLLGIFGVSGTPVLVTVAAIGVFCLLVPFRLLRAWPSGRAAMRILTGALVGLGLGFVLLGLMTEAAEDVHDKGTSSFVLMLAGFKNQWAEVHDGDGKPLSNDGRWLVLGQDGGSYVFYDCGRAETVIRPIEATTLSEIQIFPESEGARTCGHTPG
ncbi:hypothetical protein ACIBP6_32965 [Nonomuraea terrae]|uniref:hypothetical protein n=1 Tax=Nonomuraea terrae TaxID=2530383 RepID=UPI0037B8BB72